MGFKNGEFSWHVWHKDPNTGVRKWCGQFLDPESAMKWRKGQPNPGEYVVNNVGPGSVAKATGTTTTTTTTRRSSAIDIKAAERAAQREAERKRFQNRKPVTPPQPETAEQKKMKSDAAGLLEKHKSDEAADLAAGINR